MQSKMGVLLINLGTPKSTSPRDIRHYLREFLSDPRVLSIPTLARWLLLYCIILPFRPKRIQENYQAVWTQDGSPLAYFTKRLAEGVAKQLGKHYLVKCAMRYQEPALQNALDEMIQAGVTHIHIVPLFPQYAMATTGSIYARVFQLLKNKKHIPAVSFFGDFHSEPCFIDAQVAVAQPLLQAPYDHVLFTYHGLPKKHLTHFVDSGQNHCYSSGKCCNTLGAHNSYCYRAQCFATSHALAAALGITEDDYSVSFQSRFGPAEWLKPYTVDTLKQLAKTHKRVVVFCPAFTADCIETIDEIGNEARAEFIAAGGEELRLVPCVNDHPRWISGLAQAITQRASHAPNISTRI